MIELALLFSIYSLFHSAACVLSEKQPDPRVSLFVYYYCQSLAALGLAFVAVNGWLSLTDSSGDGWWLLFAGVAGIPSAVLLIAAACLGYRLKTAKGWISALILSGIAFVGILLITRSTRWNWW